MKTFALLFLLALCSATAFAAAKPEKQTITSLGAERTYYTFARKVDRAGTAAIALAWLWA